MVINTNLIGNSGSPLVKSTDRSAASSKTTSPSNNPSAPDNTTTLNSQVAQIFANAGSDIGNSGAASDISQLAAGSMLRQPGIAMLAQANLSPETVLNLLQE
jgi:flagellin-like hook-associated protein FlgL